MLLFTIICSGELPWIEQLCNHFVDAPTSKEAWHVHATILRMSESQLSWVDL